MNKNTSTLFTVLAISCCLLHSGCGKGNKPGGEGGVEVSWPGGSVSVDPEQGVSVEAPGVDVKTRTDGEVNIRTPGVEVDQQPGKSVDAGAGGDS